MIMLSSIHLHQHHRHYCPPHRHINAVLMHHSHHHHVSSSPPPTFSSSPLARANGIIATIVIHVVKIIIIIIIIMTIAVAVIYDQHHHDHHGMYIDNRKSASSAALPSTGKSLCYTATQDTHQPLTLQHKILSLLTILSTHPLIDADPVNHDERYVGSATRSSMLSWCFGKSHSPRCCPSKLCMQQSTLDAAIPSP